MLVAPKDAWVEIQSTVGPKSGWGWAELPQAAEILLANWDFHFGTIPQIECTPKTPSSGAECTKINSDQQIVELYSCDVSSMAKVAPKKTVARRRRRTATYNSYIFKIMKQVHPETRISKKGIAIINNFVTDTFEKIATEASKLCRIHKSATMASRDVQSAIRLVLPGELAKHAVSEGTKAMTKFSQA